MSANTAGPWRVLPAEASASYLRIRGTRLGHRYKVANVLAPDYFPQDAIETEANARLIAAAPELLEALKKAAEMCECYADWIKRNVMSAQIEEHPYLPELEGIAEDARELIAKATLPNPTDQPERLK